MTVEGEYPPNPDDPKPIRELLEGGVPAIDETEKAKRDREVGRTDLKHEASGLSAERTELIEEAQRTGDPTVVEAVHRKANELLRTQADLLDDQLRDDSEE
jgi:hypothetical protein